MGADFRNRFGGPKWKIVGTTFSFSLSGRRFPTLLEYVMIKMERHTFEWKTSNTVENDGECVLEYRQNGSELGFCSFWTLKFSPCSKN